MKDTIEENSKTSRDNFCRKVTLLVTSRDLTTDHKM